MNSRIGIYLWLLCFLYLVGCEHTEIGKNFYTSGNIVFQIDITSAVDVEEGETVSIDIPFTYIGKKTAKIESILGDCSCTRLTASADDLSPNQHYSLKLDYDSRGQSEGIKQVKVIMLITEGDEKHAVELLVPFQIYRRIILEPQTINLGAINGKTIIDQTVLINIIGDYDSRKIKASPSAETLHVEIVPTSDRQGGKADGYSSADLKITGSIAPDSERVYEQIYLSFPEFFGSEKKLDVKLYGMVESKIRIVPSTLFLGLMKVGAEKNVSFMVEGTAIDNIEMADIQCEEKGTFVRNDEIKKSNGQMHIKGTVVLNESAIHDTSLKLKVVFLLDGERIEQELPCVYIVDKEKP